MSQRIQRLQQQSDSMTIYREAYRIASINKDNASKRVLRYIKLLDEGKSIQIARQALSIEGAGRDLDKSTKTFKAAHRELDSCPTAARQVGDYPQAVECYELIIEKLEKKDIDPSIIAPYYIETAALYIDDGQFDKATNAVQKAIELGYKDLENLATDKRFDYILPLMDMAICTKEALRFENYFQGVLCYERAIEQLEQTTNTPIYIAPYYLDVAALYSQDKQIEKAINYIKKAIDKGFINVPRLKKDKAFDNLRNQTAFKDILHDLEYIRP